MNARNAPPSRAGKKVRYAVVGLGHIAQVAVLPAFAHARENSVLAALVSGDAVKREELGRRYGVSRTCDYEHYEDCLRSGDVDAVYIALPNSMHREYAERAADAGVHVLCEKPMAVTEDECAAMMRAAERNRVQLMIAYRLHFERANLEAIEIVRSGRIGEPRLFDATFTMHVADGNIRLDRRLGGGTREPSDGMPAYFFSAARPERLSGCRPTLGEPAMPKSSRSHKSHKSPSEMDAIELLMEDHKKVQKVFKEFEKSKDEMDEAQKGEIVRHCCTDLKIHTQLEEEIFYPAAREAIEDEELLDEAEVEHASAKQLIDELEQMEPGEDLYDARFTVLGEYVNHHIKEEEHSLFPEVKKAKLDLDELGQRMLQMKEKLQGEMETGEHAAA